MRYRTILLFGAPGSGKGTQGTILGQLPRLRHLACGDVFRSLDRQSPIGQVFSRYATGGGLVPDELTVELWQQTVDRMVAEKHYDPANELLILDGIPRTPEQAKLMADRIEVLGIIHLFVNDVQQIVARLQARASESKRSDDTSLEVIRHRLDVYEEQTRPVLELYPRNRIFRINATQPKERVTADILQALRHIDPAIGENQKGNR